MKGARIGIARDFLGADPDVDWVVDASLDAMRKAGATIVDVRYPKWLLDAKEEFYNAIRRPGVHGADRRLPEDARAVGYPKTLEEMIDRAERVHRACAPTAPAPNPGRWTLFKREAESGTLDDYRYTRCATTACRWCARRSKASSRRRSSTRSCIRPRRGGRD